MKAESKDKAALIIVRVIDNKIGVGDGLDQIMDIAYKEGRGEVVEWIKEHMDKGNVVVEWQSKLEEWGLENVDSS